MQVLKSRVGRSRKPSLGGQRVIDVGEDADNLARYGIAEGRERLHEPASANAANRPFQTERVGQRSAWMERSCR